MGKVGLIFSPTSGHPVSNQKLMSVMFFEQDDDQLSDQPDDTKTQKTMTMQNVSIPGKRTTYLETGRLVHATTYKWRESLLQR